MTVTLNLNAELEAGLFDQAQATGMTVEAYVQLVLEGAVVKAIRGTAPVEERAAAFEEWSAGHRSTRLLSDYAVTRKSFYEGRDS